MSGTLRAECLIIKDEDIVRFMKALTDGQDYDVDVNKDRTEAVFKFKGLEPITVGIKVRNGA